MHHGDNNTTSTALPEFLPRKTTSVNLTTRPAARLHRQKATLGLPTLLLHSFHARALIQHAKSYSLHLWHLDNSPLPSQSYFWHFPLAQTPCQKLLLSPLTPRMSRGLCKALLPLRHEDGARRGRRTTNITNHTSILPSRCTLCITASLPPQNSATLSFPLPILANFRIQNTC